MRLTKLNRNGVSYEYADEFVESYDKEQVLLNNYGELEDLEDELGIDLITLFNAFK